MLNEYSDVFNSDVAILPLNDMVQNFTALLSYSVEQLFKDFFSRTFFQGIRVLKSVQVAYVLESVFIVVSWTKNVWRAFPSSPLMGGPSMVNHVSTVSSYRFSTPE